MIHEFENHKGNNQEKIPIELEKKKILHFKILGYIAENGVKYEMNYPFYASCMEAAEHKIKKKIEEFAKCGIEYCPTEIYLWNDKKEKEEKMKTQGEVDYCTDYWEKVNRQFPEIFPEK